MPFIESASTVVDWGYLTEEPATRRNGCVGRRYGRSYDLRWTVLTNVLEEVVVML